MASSYKEYSGIQIRAIDLKKKLLERFGNKIQFQNDDIDLGTSKMSEYVLASDTNITGYCISSAVKGGAMSKSVAIRNIARILNKDLIDEKRQYCGHQPQKI